MFVHRLTGYTWRGLREIFLPSLPMFLSNYCKKLNLKERKWASISFRYSCFNELIYSSRLGATVIGQPLLCYKITLYNESNWLQNLIKLSHNRSLIASGTDQ